MKKSLIIMLHVGFWGCYSFLLLIILIAAFNTQTGGPPIGYIIKLILGFTVIPSVISFYAFYLLLFPKYLQHKKILPSVIYGTAISISSALIGGTILSVIFGTGFMFKDGYNSFLAEILFMSFIALVCGIIGLIIKGFITWYEELKMKEELSQKNYEMELALVKSQLDPHFLFNTINNIDVLILKDPTEASNYLNKLSDIMRFMLFDTKTDEISLAKEIKYIEKYIELQKIRTSNSNYVNFSVNGIPDSKTIAPMIFIPFIENAFKHTTNKKIENAININILIEKDTGLTPYKSDKIHLFNNNTKNSS
jgi:two-component system LytT family sensor kinase